MWLEYIDSSQKFATAEMTRAARAMKAEKKSASLAEDIITLVSVILALLGLIFGLLVWKQGAVLRHSDLYLALVKGLAVLTSDEGCEGLKKMSRKEYSDPRALDADQRYNPVALDMLTSTSNCYRVIQKRVPTVAELERALKALAGNRRPNGHKRAKSASGVWMEDWHG